MNFLYRALTDIGLGRENNEDAWAALPEHGFFAVADGMGGHNGGEVAAMLAVQSLCHSVQKVTSTDCTELMIELRYAIQKANQMVFRLSHKDPSLSGMGTTLCCLIWAKDNVIYAHVGDSRIYRLRKQKLELLTEDHSFFAKWKALRPQSEMEDASTYPYKHVITRAIGTGEKVKPAIAIATHIPGDLYFLCTDGLSDILTISEMEILLTTSEDLDIACKKMIEEAKRKGGSDNMTVLLIRSETYTETYAENLSR
ncbi:MAG: serine/threonine-protein phosphatase [Chlamydiia bacterium]|nr:serine/threonine-protein phosphatase [Chlamydiia bacterium]